jgi:hypothetical protein
MGCCLLTQATTASATTTAAVTRLADVIRGDELRVIATPGVLSSLYNGVAVSRDGSTLLVSAGFRGDAIHEFNVADGLLRRVVGKKGDKRLQFQSPNQVWIASDDFVFVAESGNCRVQVLTPRLDFHGFVGAGKVTNPSGVCANADVVVVVAEQMSHRIWVFNRHAGGCCSHLVSVNRYFDVSDNDLEGTIPDGMGVYVTSSHLRLLKDLLSRGWRWWVAASCIDITNNRLDGNIPLSLLAVSWLRFAMSIRHGRHYGSGRITNAPSLLVLILTSRRLRLGGDRLSGQLPNASSFGTYLE